MITIINKKGAHGKTKKNCKLRGFCRVGCCCCCCCCCCCFGCGPSARSAVGPSWGYVGPASGMLAPLGPAWGHLMGCVGPSLSIFELCWPIVGLCWPILRPMYLFGGYVSASWGHVGPFGGYLGPSCVFFFLASVGPR